MTQSYPAIARQGCYDRDTTEGGIVGLSTVAQVSAVTVTAQEWGDASSSYYQPPAGWSVAKEATSELGSSFAPYGVLPEDGAEGKGLAAVAEGDEEGEGEGEGEETYESKRVFHDDSEVEFDAREEFAGRRCVSSVLLL